MPRNDYEKGYRDAQEGKYSPPKGDALVDAVFWPIDALTGDKSTTESAAERVPEYNRGHSAGSNSRK